MLLLCDVFVFAVVAMFVMLLVAGSRGLDTLLSNLSVVTA